MDVTLSVPDSLKEQVVVRIGKQGGQGAARPDSLQAAIARKMQGLKGPSDRQGIPYVKPTVTGTAG